MSRAYCYQCHRAKVSCLCGRIEKQPNQVEVVVLQHPDEMRNPKGTAIIAELGLMKYTCYQGEDFTQHEALNTLLSSRSHELAILYPAAGAQTLTEVMQDKVNIRVLLIIDATWPKARKIWQLNPQLHGLPCYQCEAGLSSAYRIRKAPEEGQLSTLESIVWALEVLEGHSQQYQPMIDLFSQMIDFQIKNMGEATYKQNYEKKTR